LRFDKEKEEGKKDLVPLPPAPVQGRGGWHSNLTHLREVLGDLIGPTLESCAARERNLDLAVDNLKDDTQARLLSLAAENDSLGEALGKVRYHNRELVEENVKLITELDLQAKCMANMGAEKSKAHANLISLQKEFQEAKSEMVCMKEGIHRMAREKETSTPVKDVVGVTTPAISPIPPIPGAASVPPSAFQQGINAIRSILDDHGVESSDLSSLTAKHWVTFRSGDALMGFMPQGPKMSGLARLQTWDKYRKDLARVLDAWKDRWPTSELGELPAFVDSFYNIITAREQLTPVSGPSAAQGGPGFLGGNNMYYSPGLGETQTYPMTGGLGGRWAPPSTLPSFSPNQSMGFDESTFTLGGSHHHTMMSSPPHPTVTSPYGGPSAASDITPRGAGKDSEQMIISIKMVTPSPPPEAEGEIQMESEEVEGAQRPERSGSPVVDAAKLIDQIDILCGKVVPEGTSDVPPGESDHSDASENSSELDVDQVVGEALTDAVDKVVEEAKDSKLE
jgi:regulator of replication initiation timing